MLKTPLWITNFKVYAGAIGDQAVKLAIIHQRVAKELDKSVAVAVNSCDIYRVAQAVNIPVLAQHVDPLDQGSFTGHITPMAIKAAGAVGTMFNHSEHRLPADVLSQSTAMAQKNSLLRIVCVANAQEAEQALCLDPDFIAFEPPELIGSRDTSVARSKPDSIRQCLRSIADTPLLVGAGIRTPDDISASLDLGASGFLVASAICKADNPEKQLTALLRMMA